VENDWVKIFGIYEGLISIQQNGSAWIWSQERDGHFQKAPQSDFKGTHWVSFASEGSAILGLDTAGNVWTSAGSKRASDWRALAESWAGMGFVDASGHLWRQNPRRWQQFWAIEKPQRTSKYSDWLTVTVCGDSLIALAQSGIISSWRLPTWESATSLLAPTRKPEWSVYAY
jgi:hypothetical protein